MLTWVVEQPGTAIKRGDVLARIADLDRFRVEATISDSYASRLEAGLPVRVQIGRDERFRTSTDVAVALGACLDAI